MEEFDINKDGKITRDEFELALNKIQDGDRKYYSDASDGDESLSSDDETREVNKIHTKYTEREYQDQEIPYEPAMIGQPLPQPDIEAF